MHGPLQLTRRFLKARAAVRYARAHNLPGLDFDRYGRSVGRRLLARLSPGCAGYLVAPVANVRYWEFPFTLAHVPEGASRCLDVSSPRLFSYYVAHQRPDATVDVINPDPQDYAFTAATARRLGLRNLDVRRAGVDVLDGDPTAGMRGPYDCVWSISVIEHIDGAYTETQAVRWMFDALRPGGRLILTVPVQPAYEDEYRDSDLYSTRGAGDGAATGAGAGRYFFQRVYDEAAIRRRIIQGVGREPSVVRWYGERTPGKFREMERALIARGLEAAIDDPRQMADHYQEYPSWGAMPGFGICGLVFEKP
jgi:SAM-dependent methyltransferase